MSKPIISLTVDDKGTSVDFYDWGHETYKSKNYALLQPVDYKQLDNWGDSDVLVCEIQRNSSGGYTYLIVDDDRISDKIINQYNGTNSGSGFKRGSSSLFGAAKKAANFIVRIVFAIVGAALFLGGIGAVIGALQLTSDEMTVKIIVLVIGVVLIIFGLSMLVKNVKKLRGK